MGDGRQDITQDARLLLQAVSETKGRFGFGVPIEVLLGRNNAKVKKQGFDTLPSHGKGVHRSEDHWKAIGQSLVQELLVDGRSAGKGFGKGKKAQLTVYSVSALGRRVLDGQASAPVQADLTADAAEAFRAKRPRRSAQSPASGPSPAGAASSPGDQPARGDKRRKLPKSHAMSSQPGRPATSGENGLRPQANPGEIQSTDPLPRALDKALMPFQRAGVAFAVRREGRVLIGDDMGLGKTIQAIATMCAFRRDWPVLVVVPNSVRLVWADELERWIPDLGPYGVNVLKTSSDITGLTSGCASFHVVTYGILSRDSPVRNFLRENRFFKCVVVDESHMIKNRTSLRSRELLQIVKHAERVLLLSGTPALARPVELYTQIEAVEPGLFKSYSAFTSRYCAPKWTPFGMDFNGASNLEELHGHLQPIMVRRLKKEVLHELPEKRRQRIQLEVDKAAADACAALKDELHDIDEADQPTRHKVLMQMYKETSVAKEAPVCEYVENLIFGGCKFLVFGHHLAMLDALEATATKNKTKYIRIDGSVNANERLRRVNEFQADETVQVAILGLLAAGVGITLTAASTVVFAELHWTPGVLVQAEDRVHRIGQKSSVNIHYLVANGTIDDMIWNSVYHKVEVVSKVCDGRNDHLKVGYTSADKALEGATADVGSLLAAVSASTPSRTAKPASPQSAEKAAPSVAPVASAPASAGHNVLSMLQGRPKPQRWTCQTCGAVGAAGAASCSTCGDSRHEASAASATREAFQASKVIDVDDVIDQIESASEAEPVQEEESVEGLRRLYFCVSKGTHRVHVLDAEKRPVGCNFKLADWEALRDSATVFAEALDRDAPSVRFTEAFLRQWAALRVGEQRQLIDQPVTLPLSGHLQKKTRTSKRASAKAKK